MMYDRALEINPNNAVTYNNRGKKLNIFSRNVTEKIREI